MAITQEREDMQIAHQLKKDGWVHHIFDGDRANGDIKAMADWCRQSFGPMYSQLYPNAWAGKWYGTELPFQDMGGSTRHIVFMFRDDKIYNMFKIMFPL